MKSEFENGVFGDLVSHFGSERGQGANETTLILDHDRPQILGSAPPPPFRLIFAESVGPEGRDPVSSRNRRTV